MVNFSSSNKSNFYKKLFLFILFLSTLSFGAYLFKDYVLERNGMYAYNPTKDRAFILNIFKNDWDWLVSRYSTDFSAEYIFDNATPDRDPENIGKLQTKVYYDHNQPVGFVSYWQRPLYEGNILFVAVDKAFRGKGYAPKMVKYAIDDLKKHGSAYVRILTRVDNVKARKVYEGVGFKEIWTDGEFIRYQIN